SRCRWGGSFVVGSAVAASELLLRKTKLKLVSVPHKCSRLRTWAMRRRANRGAKRLDARQPHLSIYGVVVLEAEVQQQRTERQPLHDEGAEHHTERRDEDKVAEREFRTVSSRGKC